MIEFDYREERSRTGDVILRPVAKVHVLKPQGEWIPHYFYVDSGADYTVVPYRVGRFLGLEPVASEVKEMGGIGGIVGARFATVPLRIDRHQFDCVIAWAQIEHVPLLPGRKDVFDRFDITFRQKDRKTAFAWRG